MGAKAFGVQNPTQGETAVSWQTWSDGDGGIPIITGGSVDWGKLGLNIPDEGRSAVYDLGSEATRTFTLTENRYGMGRGSAVLQYRTDTSSFAQDDALPAWTDYTVPFSVNCRYIQIRETMAEFTYFYVDNAASGNNDGTSWTDAWESFADINWTTLANASQAHLYISGGSVSKTYLETLTIGDAGTAGDFITIDVGANSPSPSGHSGIVYIDGDHIRTVGIKGESWVDYVRINGLDNSGNYKLKVRNIVHDTALPISSYCIDMHSGTYVYLDYIECLADAMTGITFSGETYGRIRGCRIITNSEADCAMLGIYVASGSNNIIENNVVLMDIIPVLPNYADLLQIYGTGSVIVRNNYLAWVTDTGAHDCAGIQSSSMPEGDVRIYNNVIIGSNLADGRATFHITTNAGGMYYIWNNTIISPNPTTEDNNGGSIRIESVGMDGAHVGAIKNNIVYNAGQLCFNFSSIEITDHTKVDYNCLRSGGEHVSYENGYQRTWAEHQAHGFDAHGTNSDPLYDTNDEYRLNDGDSPCINVGADLSAYFTTDKDGNIRPTGQWDIGAYEYTAG